MTTHHSIHPLDAALALSSSHSEGAGQYTGHTSPAYWNMVGPFGGITAATLLQAVMQHPDRLGEPLSLTVNYAGALAEGPFTLQATPVRTNRSTQHWTLSILQAGADGAPVVTTTATVVTAARRETWGAADTPMPQVPAPAQCKPVQPAFRSEWLQRYEMRPVTGALPEQWDDSGDTSLSQLWMRDDPPRPLDFAGLTGLADVFLPRVWRRRAVFTPIGTVSMTVYFHTGAAELAATGSGHLLGQARAQAFYHGFFDQSAELWNQAGQLLATTHQIVYYKE